MPRPPKLTPEQIDDAAERLARGRGTKASIAAELGVSAPGLGQAIARRAASLESEPRPKVSPLESLAEAPAQPAAPPPRNESAEASGPVDPESLDLAGQKAFYSKIVKDCERDYARLAGQGETEEARKVLALGIQAANALARITRHERGDALVLSKEDLTKRKERVRTTIETYLDTKRPLLCAHCQRKLAIKWGKGE
jgi:hypothetical protein